MEHLHPGDHTQIVREAAHQPAHSAAQESECDHSPQPEAHDARSQQRHEWDLGGEHQQPHPGEGVQVAPLRAHQDGEEHHRSLQAEEGQEGEGEDAEERSVAQQDAPVAPPRPERPSAAPRKREGEQGADGDERRADREDQPEQGLARAGLRLCRTSQRVDQEGKATDADGEADGSPHANATEEVPAALAQERQADGDEVRDQRDREERQTQRAEREPRKAPRQDEQRVARRRPRGQQRQHARAAAGPVRYLAPERLGQDARQRGNGHHHADLCARQPGVLAQVQAVEREEEPQSAQDEQPDQRQQPGCGHRCTA